LGSGSEIRVNWEAVGAIAEFVGAIGVIASLFYLASQIRRNSASVEAATASSVSESSQQRLLAVAQSPELAEAIRKTLAGEELIGNEATLVEFYSRAMVRSIENTFIQYQRGLIGSDLWTGHESLLQTYLRAPEFSGWWATDRDSYDQRFRAIVDRLLGEPTAA
jgi:hypothetical protein